jgi:lipopolysaccharide export system ATP-binding protein
MHDPGSTCCHTETAVLFANGLRKTYGGRAVVDGVSMTVQPREIVGLLGPNGAGKTTSFYMIAGLVPADAGLGLLPGHDISKLPMHRRARLGLGYLPQEESVFRKLSVLDNLLAILETRPNLSRADRHDRAHDLMAASASPSSPSRWPSPSPAVKSAASPSPARSARTPSC